MYKTPNKLKLDIIIIGFDEDKNNLRAVVDNLQEQLNRINRQDIGVIFGLGTKEPNNIEEIKQRVLGMTNCEYFVFFNATESFFVMPDYIQNLIRIIESSENEENGDEIIAAHGINKLNG